MYIYTQKEGGIVNYRHLKRYRRKKKWTLREAAEASGVSFVYIRELEEGFKTNPSVAVLDKLAKAYGITLNEAIHKKAS